MTVIESRIYCTLLELCFDIERLMNIKIVKTLQFHYHCSTFHDKTIKPYVLIFTDNENKSYTKTAADIYKSFGYLPLYSTSKIVGKELGCVEMNGPFKQVTNKNKQYETFKKLYSEYLAFERKQGYGVINKEVIENVKAELDCASFECEETDEYIYVTNFDTCILKIEGECDEYRNVVYPMSPITFNDEYICIGYFYRYNDEFMTKNEDLCLALITVCDSCNEPMLVNYNATTVCPNCSNSVYL